MLWYLLIALKLVVGTEAHIANGNILYQEIIKPDHVGQHARSKRDLSTKNQQGDHLNETVYEFYGLGRYFVVYLYKNRNLLSDNFVVFTQKPDGSEYARTEMTIENCHYQGFLLNRTGSSVTMSTCDGLRGLIKDSDGEEFFVEKVSNEEKNDVTNSNKENETYIIYRMKDLITKKKGKCGLNHTRSEVEHDFSMQHFFNEHWRERRAVSDKKYIEVAVVIDNRKARELGEAKSINLAIEVINNVDSVYKTLNTRVVVVSVTVWTVVDKIHIALKAGTTLDGFKTYYSTVMLGTLKMRCDNAQLITGIDFDGDTVGLAPIGTMCGYSSCAINQYHGNPAMTANTVAHEMGHNIGMIHDTDTCKCSKSPCVMTEYAASSPVQSFSSCSQDVFNKRSDNGEIPCILDYPSKLYGAPKCQNGFLEEGETCDCGTPKECADSGAIKCCNPATCKLTENSQCAVGSCCDTSTCKFKNQGTLCRDKFNDECDLPEYCNGTFKECVSNFYVKDGTTCQNGEGYCYGGSCKSISTQCKLFWGPNVKEAELDCFLLNTKPVDKWANCGKNDRDLYIPCAVGDAKCGKLQCSPISPGLPVPNLPIIGTNRGTNVIGKCRMGFTSMGPDLDDPSLAMDGTKCADNSVCVKKKCTNISTIATIKKCSTTCLNGGVCNNEGNCHCPPGFACPNCEFAGPGGSLNSGQGCILQSDCGCLTPLVKGLLVLFLLVIPLLCISLYFMYRYRENIRLRFSHARETRNRKINATKHLNEQDKTAASKNIAIITQDDQIIDQNNSKQFKKQADVTIAASKSPAVLTYQNSPRPYNKVSEKYVPYSNTNVTAKHPGTRSPYLASESNVHSSEINSEVRSTQKKVKNWPPPSSNA
ncbi:zinc metalloproteinase-disintegrin-like MTP8 isoform X3 [Hydra vulgaris]|uniref:Zinc metalloproteinase-disintegrin-like MTP8 isoform X3 n=1 Tax=Hydra vulgaris TaxID=6087 RepID=A0ABM4BKD6_HYDVU